MAKLTPQFSIPTKVVTVRLEHMKKNLQGIHKEIEKRAISREETHKKLKVKDALLLSWDDWINAALDVQHKNKVELANQNLSPDQMALKQTKLLQDGFSNKNPLLLGNELEIPQTANNVYEKALGMMTLHQNIKAKESHWSDGYKVGDAIPYHLIDDLPVTVGELVTLGNWMYHKNIYRFEDIVIKEVLKSEFKGNIPSYVINLPHLSTYVQTDNSDLKFYDEQVVGVLFSHTTLNEEDVLVVTLYTDTGNPHTITMSILEDKDIDECVGDFLDKAMPDAELADEDKEEHLTVMRKLINLVLWFSKKEPEILAQHNNGESSTFNFKIVDKHKRLFEANSYRPYLLGSVTAKLFKNIYEDLEKEKRNYPSRSGGVTPHLRASHWQTYWHGKRKIDERGKHIGEYWEVVLHPIRMIGGTPKNTGNS